MHSDRSIAVGIRVPTVTTHHQVAPCRTQCAPRRCHSERHMSPNLSPETQSTSVRATESTLLARTIAAVNHATRAVRHGRARPNGARTRAERLRTAAHRRALLEGFVTVATAKRHDLPPRTCVR